jgi:outer membrane protein insertion porin family
VRLAFLHRAAPVLALIALVATSSPARSADDGTISDVWVRGNRRVETSAIRVHISVEPGETIQTGLVDGDIKAIYAMGFFDNVWVTAEDTDTGTVLVYNVSERPYIEKIEFKGVDKVDPEDLEAVIKITPRTIFDPQRVWIGLEQARKFYSSEGYPDAELSFEVVVNPANNAALVYKVDEGELIRVEDIRFEGVHAFKKRELKKLMTTRERWFLSFLTGAGLLNEDELTTDVERVTAYYYDNGYIHARVDEPHVERVDSGLEVTIKVEEGPLFHVREILFEGDTLIPDDEMLASIGVEEGGIFRASELREAVFTLTEMYGDLGYAFADITPDTRTTFTGAEIDVKFDIRAGDIVHIRRIEVRGNSKTRDKVVRRELQLEEGEKFSGTGLRRSKTNLSRIGFFDEVEITTKRTEETSEVDLLVQVKEGRTGAFSAGAGFSSADNLLFNARISEQNLFGRAQRLVLNADIGSIRQNFQLSFTEPWFRNRPLAVGFDLFDWRLQFDRFTRGATGFGLRASYPLRDLGLGSFFGLSLNRVRIGSEYRLEEARINGVSKFAPPDVKDQEGSRTTSAFIPSLSRNTLNHAFDPTNGSRQILSGEFAGVGGGSEYFKIDFSGKWFWPTFKVGERQFVFSFGANLGYGLGKTGVSGEEIPVFDRYFPGGINSNRGFDARSMGPTQFVTDEYGDRDRESKEEIGGSALMMFNNDFIIPVVPDAGVKAVVWADVGNAYLADDAFDVTDLRYASGLELRWLSPFGPLRISYGWNLDPQNDEDKRVVLFSFGAPF